MLHHRPPRPLNVLLIVGIVTFIVSTLSPANPPNVAPAPAVERPLLSCGAEYDLQTMLSLNVEDLRTKATQTKDYESIRLMCFSTRRFAYVFHVAYPRAKDAKLEWSEYDFNFRDKVNRSGTVPLSEASRLALLKAVDSPVFRTTMDDDKPVSIGHPYQFLVEIIESGNYRIIRRDTPEYDWQSRGLAGFNHVARTLMLLAKVTQPECHAPIPPDPISVKSGVQP